MSMHDYDNHVNGHPLQTLEAICEWDILMKRNLKTEE